MTLSFAKPTVRRVDVPVTFTVREKFIMDALFPNVHREQSGSLVYSVVGCMSSSSTPKSMVPGVPRRVVRLCQQSRNPSGSTTSQVYIGGTCFSVRYNFEINFCDEFAFLIAILICYYA